jgi:hypothetical protein
MSAYDFETRPTERRVVRAGAFWRVGLDLHKEYSIHEVL